MYTSRALDEAAFEASLATLPLPVSDTQERGSKRGWVSASGQPSSHADAPSKYQAVQEPPFIHRHTALTSDSPIESSFIGKHALSCGQIDQQTQGDVTQLHNEKEADATQKRLIASNLENAKLKSLSKQKDREIQLLRDKLNKSEVVTAKPQRAAAIADQNSFRNEVVALRSQLVSKESTIQALSAQLESQILTSHDVKARQQTVLIPESSASPTFLCPDEKPFQENKRTEEAVHSILNTDFFGEIGRDHSIQTYTSACFQCGDCTTHDLFELQMNLQHISMKHIDPMLMHRLNHSLLLFQRFFPCSFRLSLHLTTFLEPFVNVLHALAKLDSSGTAGHTDECSNAVSVLLKLIFVLMRYSVHVMECLWGNTISLPWSVLKTDQLNSASFSSLGSLVVDSCMRIIKANAPLIMHHNASVKLLHSCLLVLNTASAHSVTTLTWIFGQMQMHTLFDLSKSSSTLYPLIINILLRAAACDTFANMCRQLWMNDSSESKLRYVIMQLLSSYAQCEVSARLLASLARYHVEAFTATVLMGRNGLIETLSRALLLQNSAKDDTSKEAALIACLDLCVALRDPVIVKQLIKPANMHVLDSVYEISIAAKTHHLVVLCHQVLRIWTVE